MQHTFDIDIAAKYGVEEAILLNHLWFWIQKNEANDRHFHDGLYWTYNSIKAFSALFPYMSHKKIRNALQKLEDAGLILKGNFNDSTYDRTMWYTLTEKGKSILPKGQMDFPQRANGGAQKGKSTITVINTVSKPDSKTPDDDWPGLSEAGFSEAMRERVRDWLQYKKERREQYKPTGLKSLLTTIQNRVNQHGEEAVMNLISECMAANYQGIIWDKIKNAPQQRRQRQDQGMPETTNSFARYLQRIAAEGEGDGEL